MRPHDVNSKLVGVTTAKCPKLLSPTTPPPPSTLSSLPDDVMAKILVKFPVTTLFQWRGVCKSWKTLISSSQFARYHSLQHSPAADPTPPRLAYYNVHGFIDRCRIGIFSIKSVFENPATKVFSFKMECCEGIVGSCNGLLCLRDNKFRVRLWNPLTKLASEWIELENPKKEKIGHHGFGYDHVHDKYKLIVSFGYVGKVTKVYTFGSNSYKTILLPDLFYWCAGTFTSGALNWIASEKSCIGSSCGYKIISFDLGNETFGQMSIPCGIVGSYYPVPVLGVLRNCLCICFKDTESCKWVVWMMKEYGVDQSWTKLVMIPIVDDLPVLSLEPLYISENDTLLARSNKTCKLVMYNSSGVLLDYPRLDTSLVDGPETMLSDPRIVHIYHESLISPPHCGLED